MSRTTTPIYRSSFTPQPVGNLKAAVVDSNFSGVAAVANAAAIVVQAANQAARLALGAAVQIGDLCYQLDAGSMFVLTALPASTDGNWGVVGSGSSSVGFPWWDPTPVVPLASAFTWALFGYADLPGALQISGQVEYGLRAGAGGGRASVPAAMLAISLTDTGASGAFPGAYAGILGVNAAGDAAIFWGYAIIAGAVSLRVESFAFPAMTSTTVHFSKPSALPSCPVKLSASLSEDSGSNRFYLSLGDNNPVDVFDITPASSDNYNDQVGLACWGDAGTVINVADWEGP